MLVKLVLGGKPSEMELRTWISRMFFRSRTASWVQKILDMPRKFRILGGVARHDPETLAKAIIVRKVSKEIHRKIFNS